MGTERTALLIIDVQPEIVAALGDDGLVDGCGVRDEEVHRVLCEKVFPRQATVMTVAGWIGSLA